MTFGEKLRLTSPRAVPRSRAKRNDSHKNMIENDEELRATHEALGNLYGAVASLPQTGSRPIFGPC